MIWLSIHTFVIEGFDSASKCLRDKVERQEYTNTGVMIRWNHPRVPSYLRAFTLPPNKDTLPFRQFEQNVGFNVNRCNSIHYTYPLFRTRVAPAENVLQANARKKPHVQATAPENIIQANARNHHAGHASRESHPGHNSRKRPQI